MIKTYKYKLYNNETYLKKYDKWIGICRYIYNVAKEVRDENYNKGININYYDLAKQLTEAKKEVSFIKQVNSQSLQSVIERLENSWKQYFRKLKDGSIDKEKSKYIEKKTKNGGKIKYNKLKNFGKPEWAKKGKFKTINFKNTNNSLRETIKGFKLPTFGEVKVFNKKYKINGKIKQAKLTLEADGLYLNVIVECENKIRENQSDNVVAVDMGIKYFLTTSDGEFINNPRYFFKFLKQLRVEQRSLQRKYRYKSKNQSKNFEKQRKVIARLYQKIARTRKDFLHKLSSKLANTYSTVVIEDLKVSEMVRNTKYSKHISDVAWSMFFELLSSKTNVVRINPAYSSQECSKCGHTHKDNRPTQSLFECVKCGHTENADLNGANTLLNRYLQK